MSHRRPGTVLGQGLQEEYLAPLLEERGAAGDDAASDRREILNFHFQRRTGAEMMLEEMAHRDVESCRENPSVKRALRIVLERLDLEGNDARLAFVRHVHAEEAGQEEGPELLASVADGRFEDLLSVVPIHRLYFTLPTV